MRSALPKWLQRAAANRVVEGSSDHPVALGKANISFVRNDPEDHTAKQVIKNPEIITPTAKFNAKNMVEDLHLRGHP